MKNVMRLDENLMNKNVTKEMIEEATDLEVKIEQTVTDDLGNNFDFYPKGSDT